MSDTTITTETTETTETTLVNPFAFAYAETETYAKRVTDAINAQLTTTSNAIEKLGAMIAAAYAQEVWDTLGYDSWSDYVAGELHFDGFKPDTSARKFLVGLFREAGMEFAEVAEAVKASVRTVKSDAEEAGKTSKRPARPEGNKPAAGKTSKPAAGNPVTVAPAATDAQKLAALHAVMDTMTVEQLLGLQAYAAELIRRANAKPAADAA